MINGLGSVKKRAEAFAAREGQIILVSMSQHKKDFKLNLTWYGN